MLSVCILNYNDSDTTIKLVEHLKKYEKIDYIVVVDNHSLDDSYEKLKKVKNRKVHILRTERNGGYGFGNNYGVIYCKEKLKAKYVAICNPDILVSENALIKCTSFLKKNNKAALTAPMMEDGHRKVVYDCAWPLSSGISYLCFSLILFGNKFKTAYSFWEDMVSPKKVDCLAGSLIVVDIDKFINCGMYDEKVFLYCEETILGIKLKNAGYDSYLLPDIRFRHYHSVSINKSINNKLMQKRIMWKSRFYVLKNYYKWNKYQMIIAYLIGIMWMIQEYAYLLIKKLWQK